VDFFGRETELALLEKLWQAVDTKARMAVITGRRRIGKTLLSMKFTQKKRHLYLFVAKKTEPLLCQEFIKQIQENFTLPVIGSITSFRDVFALLLEISKKEPFVLVLDEIQEFLHINSSIFSDIQELWDRNLHESRIFIIMMGSVYSLMKKIFEDSYEPLFGRADRIVRLKPFSISTLHEIIKQKNGPTIEHLFNYYLVTGGVPKYVEELLTEGVFTEDAIFDCILSVNSPFLEEGKNVLIEEFGKEYSMYFSILELLSCGKTSRSELESVLQKDIGGYLDRLENYFSVIEKFKPITAKPQTKMVRYKINDLFLRFWFCFIFRNRSAIETANFDYVRRILQKSLSTYKGAVLEDFFKSIFAESNQFNKIGSYWDHDHTNEIDLVCVNDLDKKIVLAEIKRNKDKIRIETLKKKGEKLLKHYPGYAPEYLSLSLEDAKKFL